MLLTAQLACQSTININMTCLEQMACMQQHLLNIGKSKDNIGIIYS